jgi:hypothetical protein
MLTDLTNKFVAFTYNFLLCGVMSLRFIKFNLMIIWMNLTSKYFGRKAISKLALNFCLQNGEISTNDKS